MGVVGSISIKDNATGVLKGLRKEQSEFKKETAAVGSELKRTWGQTLKAKVETAPAVKNVASLIAKTKELGSKAISPVIKAKDMVTGTVSKVTGKLKALGSKITSPFIKAKDLATGVISKVGGKLKSLGSKITTPMVKLKDLTAKGISSISGKLKSLAKATVIPVTVAAVTSTIAIAGASIKEGAKLEQSIGGVETLFKADAGLVKKNADSAFKTAGLSANDYMEQVTSFSASLLNSLKGDTAKAAGVADMAMVDMADNANKFGSDIESIQNAYQGFAKQNYTMLDNLKLGYGGTKEEMQRLLKDAGKLTGVKYKIDNLSDVYNAIHAIQEELGVAGTTAKEASETFSGSFSAMKASAKNLLGNMAIGGDVEGSLGQLFDTAGVFLEKNAIPMVKRIFSSMPGIIKTTIGKLAPEVKSAIKNIAPEIKGAIKNIIPKIKGSGADIAKGLRDGIKGMLPPSMGAIVDGVFDKAEGIGNAFMAALPDIIAFGNGLLGTFSQIQTSLAPVNASILSTVTTLLPVMLPVIQTVVGTIAGMVADAAPLISGLVGNISSIVAQAAPVISGLVEGIGTVVSALAPVFATIFNSIGEKVGSVLSFVGERMGFIQEVIGTVAPLVGDIISTSWKVISPIIDIAISVFKILFGVVQKVFPGIQSIIETTWNIVKPLVEGIGSVIGKIAGWFGSVADAMNGAGTDAASVGKNARGTNNWKGGLTWVGEEGAELVDLPKGSRVLPHKESVSLSGGGAKAGGGISNITLTIAKIADSIIVRDEGDIDEIADRVAKKVTEVVVNMA